MCILKFKKVILSREFRFGLKKSPH
jgi:hypothetical protein